MSIAEPPGTPTVTDADGPERVWAPDEGAGPAAGGADDAPGTARDHVPASDVVRDVVAAVALLTCLALPWTARSVAADHVEVVLSVVVALAAIPLPYLARAGVLPTGWSIHTTRAARLWAAAPFVVVSVVYLLLDLFAGSALGDRGVGTGLGLGLAGALLVAQPRACELGPDDEDAGVGRLWRLVLGVIAAAVAVGDVVALVIFLSSSTWSGATSLLLALCAALLILALGAFPAWGAFRGDRAWSVVVVGVGAALAVLFVVGAGSAPDLLRYESFHVLRFGLVLVPALGAVAAGAAFGRSVRGGSDADGTPADPGAAVARDTLLLLAVVAAIVAIARVVALTGGLHGSSVVVTLVTTGAVAVLAGLAWGAGRSSQSAGRGLAWLVVVAAVVLGTVAVSVDTWKVVGVPVELAMVAYGLPVLLALALLGPSVRAWGERTQVEAPGPRTAYEWTPRRRRAPRPAAERRPAVPPAGGPAEDGQADERQAEEGHAAHEPGRPVQEPVRSEPEPEARAVVARSEAAEDAPARDAGRADAAQAADAESTTVLPVAGYTADQAADPSTPLEVLAQIAEHAPALRPHVASNPATYPALLDWLGALGDPAVDAALRARGDRRG